MQESLSSQERIATLRSSSPSTRVQKYKYWRSCWYNSTNTDTEEWNRRKRENRDALERYRQTLGEHLAAKKAAAAQVG